MNNEDNNEGVADETSAGPSVGSVAETATRYAATTVPNAPAHWLAITKINRYKCVHCGKVGYSAGHMRKHAKRCTNNPDRKCGMHHQEHLFDRGGSRFDGYEVKQEVQVAIALLPDPSQYAKPTDYGFDDYPGLLEAVTAAMPLVSAAVSGCPACTLAALRQRGIPYMPEAFDFKKTAKAWIDKAKAEYGE